MCVQHLFIREPKCGLFYINDHDRMCFQCSIDLSKAPTEHLFHPRMECKHKPQVDCYPWIIYYEMDKRRHELACDDFMWIKPKIIPDVDKVSVEDLLLE